MEDRGRVEGEKFVRVGEEEVEGWLVTESAKAGRGRRRGRGVVGYS